MLARGSSGWIFGVRRVASVRGSGFRVPLRCDSYNIFMSRRISADVRGSPAFSMDLSRPLAMVSGGRIRWRGRAHRELGSRWCCSGHGLRGEKALEGRGVCAGLAEAGPGFRERRARSKGEPPIERGWERYRFAEQLASNGGFGIATDTRGRCGETVVLTPRGAGLRGCRESRRSGDGGSALTTPPPRRTALLRAPGPAPRTDPTQPDPKYARTGAPGSAVLEELSRGRGRTWPVPLLFAQDLDAPKTRGWLIRREAKR